MRHELRCDRQPVNLLLESAVDGLLNMSLVLQYSVALSGDALFHFYVAPTWIVLATVEANGRSGPRCHPDTDPVLPRGQNMC